MKKVKQFLRLLFLCAPLITQGQRNEKGIQWTTGLSWKQIKQKAKTENKYIFIDVYTTWCGPCKMMEKTVYINDTVGQFFNQHFISVKVQMDRTANDDKFVQSWYNDAETIRKTYMIEGYPTAIFLSPEGIITHKDGGFKPSQDFISMAKLALSPGKVYEDPYLEYKRLVKEYEQGIKHYGRMPYMIQTAFKTGDINFANQLLNEHIDYFAKASISKRYTRDNIELWAGAYLTSKSKTYQFFYKDGEQIDRTMNRKGYAENVIDKVIMEEIIVPFLEEQDKKGIIAKGERFTEVDENKQPLIKKDSSEADWNKLYDIIKGKFNQAYAERNVLLAQVRWYKQLQNYPLAANYYFLRLDKYPVAVVDESTAVEINSHAWYIFLFETNKKRLENVTQWMEKAVKAAANYSEVLDTYANLLHKIGRTKEGIEWQKKALKVVSPMYSNDILSYKKAIEKMQKGEPTYLEQGAIW